MHLAYLLAQEAAQEERNPILPAANELIWGAVSFLILLFLMYRTVWPQVNKAYKDRRANIEGKLEQAEKERTEAEELLDKYKQRLAAAEDETQRILEEARANAERVRKDLLAKAETDAERLAQALASTFGRRARQPLPDVVPPPPRSWARPYVALAGEVGLAQDLDDGHAAVAAWLDPILASKTAGTWDPQAKRWR